MYVRQRVQNIKNVYWMLSSRSFRTCKRVNIEKRDRILFSRNTRVHEHSLAPVCIFVRRELGTNGQLTLYIILFPAVPFSSFCRFSQNIVISFRGNESRARTATSLCRYRSRMYSIRRYYRIQN